jgi:hypothetical protein
VRKLNFWGCGLKGSHLPSASIVIYNNGGVFMFTCDECGKPFKSEKGLKAHIWRVHTDSGKQHNANRNVDLNASVDCVCGKTLKNRLALQGHQNHCRVFLGDGVYFAKVVPRQQKRAADMKAKRSKEAWNKGKTAKDNESVRQLAKTMSENAKAGKNAGSFRVGDSRHKSEEIRKKIQETMLTKDCSDRHPNSVRTDYVCVDGSVVHLQSTYELRVAETLDNNGVRWMRPKCLYYVAADGVRRRYYPDFYLLDYGVYLDPKNEYLEELDKDKIGRVMYDNGVSVYILSESELDWVIIRNMICSGRVGLEAAMRTEKSPLRK